MEPQTGPDPAALAARLRIATMRLGRRLSREGEGSLSPAEVSALATVSRREPIGLGELANREQVRPPTMTRIAASLEARGLVARTVDRGDRRRAYLETTAAGRQFVQHNRRRKNAYLARKLRGVDRRGLLALEEAVGTLERLLEE
ncbi:MAG: MarR family transcriptional regulator [Candidatus Dormibacteraeota bacterium]|nr:MarR family transcriptional regulator [Candidatus Dormibacteraeota bacterium]MBO0759879.1 MarR family transcriptional regulator [Candidatus Dormibacteraeota bacterium]